MFVFISLYLHLSIILLYIAFNAQAMSNTSYLRFSLAIAWVRHSDRRLFLKFPEVVFMDFTANTTKVTPTLTPAPAHTFPDSRSPFVQMFHINVTPL